MRRPLLFLCAVAAALGAPARRVSLVGKLGKATAGIAIGSAATNMATDIASQSLGLAGQALGQIPFLGPLAQVGTTIGQAGVEVGKTFAQMGLGIGQAAFNVHGGAAALNSRAAGQNIIQALGASAPAVHTSVPAAAHQQAPGNPTSDGVFVPHDVASTFEYDDYYNDQGLDYETDASAQDGGTEASSRPPPPQPTLVGAK